MVKIRLRRMGAKKAPYYRIVVADSPASAGASPDFNTVATRVSAL